MRSAALALAAAPLLAAARASEEKPAPFRQDTLATAGVSTSNYRDGGFVYKPGYLGAGDDLPYNGPYNYTGAVAACAADLNCMAFTFNSANQQPTQPVNVFFKSAVNYVCCDATWSTYVKSEPPAYPAVNFTVAGLKVGLRANSHSVQIMGLVNDSMPPYNFSFVPPLTNGKRQDRSMPRCHQLGDVSIRVQPLSETNASSWALYQSSWAGGNHPAIPLPSPLPPGVLVADDITPLLNATPPSGRIVPAFPLSLTVVRSYETATSSLGQELVMRFNITATDDVRIGGLGFSLPADDVTDQQLDQIAYTNSFLDGHIGKEHGWAEWTRITAVASMMVLPGTPQTKAEAFRPLLEDCGFTGSMVEWTVLSGAWAADWLVNAQAPVLSMPDDLAKTGVWPDPLSPWPSWRGGETVHVPGLRDRLWLNATTLDMKKGQTASFALRFVLTPAGPRSKDETLLAAGEPVLEAVPGYTLSMDMSPQSTFLLVTVPPGMTIASVASEPATVLGLGEPAALPSAGLYQVPITPLAIGRARLLVRFSDGSEAVAHYRVVPPLSAQVGVLGAHWANVSWLPREYPDPFGRSASVMPWDREDGVHVIDDSRAYIVGLSDDAGAGNNLGFSTKVGLAPVQFEVDRVDEYIANTLYGVKPDVAKPPLRSLMGRPEDGPQFEDQIRMTVYYYCQSPGECKGNNNFAYNYSEQDKCSMPVGGPIWCMTENMADAVYRGYNVPHSTAVWLGMYRVARHFDLLKTAQPWSWYLERGYRLAYRLGSPDVGLMDGTVFRELLNALEEEGALNSTIAGWAQELKGNMKVRADGWSTAVFPYGSEFNYDSTGQEEVYLWLSAFGYQKAANATLESILGYMRSIPNWAWNGGARSMGDLGNNGKWFINRGAERVLMHYRAGLNMIPLLEHYRAFPDDYFLLPIAMGAITGQLTNIDPATGATSMGFHSFPFILEHDPRSGDYGLGFFGLSTESGAYLVRHPNPAVGWACFLCNLQFSSNQTASFVPLDPYKVRVYLEPLGLHLVAQSGYFSQLSLDLTAAKRCTITFLPAAAPIPASTQTAAVAARPYSFIRLQVTKASSFRPGSGFQVLDGAGQPVPVVRGAYQVTPAADDTQPTTVTLTWQ